MAGAAARALQYEYKAVGVNFMYEKLKAVVNTNAGTAKSQSWNLIIWILQQ